jgi:polysaccharide deacetylase family protein (PEP-CTERM system associated)
MTVHVLTVDAEDWYHVENLRPATPPESWPGLRSRFRNAVDRMLELFEKRKVRATFFVLGVAAEREPAVIRSIVAAGHELACHGWSHDLVYRQTPERFREETRRAKALLEDLGSCEVRGYRASTFSITRRSLWALDVLAEEGFSYDSSIAPLRHDRYGIPGAPAAPHVRRLSEGRSLLEFPVSVMRVLGWRFPLGGGFFRLFPLRWTERALRRQAAAGWPGMIYVHPWEFDPDQPRVQGIGLVRRFRHYYGLDRSRDKLDRLLSRNAFEPMGAALDRWSTTNPGAASEREAP